jgi:hypothetical protein
MFVVIYEPSTDVTLYSRRMGPNETIDARRFADMIAAEYDREIDEQNGHIPDCCGDIRVEFRPRKNVSWHIWDGQSFYFKRD